ncbi:MAG: type IX secretion system sortase PorU [Flavicella sp.]
MIDLKQNILLFFVVITLNVFSQTTDSKSISLDWDLDSKLVSSDGTEFNIPLVKNQFLSEQGLPTFNTTWHVLKGTKVTSYRISNIKYGLLSSSQLKNIPSTSISDSLISSFSISKAKEIHHAHLNVIPLVKKDGVIKRVVSFDLQYKLSKNSSFNRTKAVKSKTNSVLSSGSWYKISIDKSGVYKLDKNFFESLGISTSSLNPKNIRVYGNGGVILPQLNSVSRPDDLLENSLYVSGGLDGIFDDNDYVLFYGVGPHSWNLENENTIGHINNIYSDKAYYFITVDNGDGSRVQEKNSSELPTTTTVTSYKDFIYFEEDSYNLFGIGQQWFGDSFTLSNSKTYNFDFKHLDVTQPVKIKVRGIANSSRTSSMSVSVNNNSSHDFSIFYNASNPAIHKKAYDSQNSNEINLTADEIDVKITYNNNGIPSAAAYLDYIEIIGDKLLIADGSQFSFRSFLSLNTAEVLEYQIANKSQIDMVWDITNPHDPKLISDISSSTDNYSFKEASGTLNEYVVVNTNDLYVPEIVSQNPIENQNLHALKDIEYVVIAKKDMSSQAQRLADYHEANSNLTTRVVSLEHIYNEFGSGSPDITAIRDFVKFLYDNASSDDTKIKYVCLFGDATYDFKDRLPDNNNIIPAFQSYNSTSDAYSYVTDDYYGIMDENEGNLSSSDKQDVATGRILVSNNLEAKNVVDKILNYYSEASLGNWRNNLSLFTDDFYNESEFVFQTDMEAIADGIKTDYPQFNITKLYADSFKKKYSSSTASYPDLNIALSNAVENGTLVIDYFGHGGELGLGSENLLRIPEIKSWLNFDKSPLFITVTCEFSKFDNPIRVTAGEEMILNKNGGSSSLISTARAVFINYGLQFNKYLIPNLLATSGTNSTIADALMLTKNTVNSYSTQRFFIFNLGDPAMRLGIPSENIKVTKINGKDVSVERDVLKALSKVRIEGEVTDANGVLTSNFNGIMTSIIFDKETDKNTLNNDGLTDSEGNPLVMTYDVQQSVVFKGDVKVENGKFDFEFIVPKDIKSAVGLAKISMYAKDANKNSKGGVDKQTYIGGINEDAPEDTTGPQISLFMNDTSFSDGGITNSSPNLIAEFTDESGINTSLASIGHNITAVLDGDEANPISLNNFYESAVNDYQSGNVTYKLRDLTAGIHTIKIKVWDTYNNSSEATLTFNVVLSDSFSLENVLNYPNPFVNYTEFWFNHNQPNAPLEVKIFIFTVSGKLVKTLVKNIQTTGGLSRSITWDGKDEFGQKIGKGVYVYNLMVTNTDTGASAEKIEKLVILQ